ncbi:hypothetical protein LINGRAHAP2_LOCUS3353 [Linum grandiflorum]
MVNGGLSSSSRSQRSSEMSNHGNLQSFLFISLPLHLQHLCFLLHLHYHCHHKQTQKRNPQNTPDATPHRHFPHRRLASAHRRRRRRSRNPDHQAIMTVGCRATHLRL